MKATSSLRSHPGGKYEDRFILAANQFCSHPGGKYEGNFKLAKQAERAAHQQSKLSQMINAQAWEEKPAEGAGVDVQTLNVQDTDVVSQLVNVDLDVGTLVLAVSQ